MSTIKVRIYYEDTDLSGMVYHANYLKYMERGRTEFLSSHGFELSSSHEVGTVYAVTELKIQYRYTAKYNDMLKVVTTLDGISSYQVMFKQEIFNQDEKLLTRGWVKVVAVDAESGGLAALPDEFVECANKILKKGNK